MTHPFPQTLRHMSQDRVTSGVTIGIVDGFEMVHIQNGDGKHRVIPFGTHDLTLKFTDDRAAVEQEGQRVGLRHLAGLRHHRIQLDLFIVCQFLGEVAFDLEQPHPPGQCIDQPLYRVFQFHQVDKKDRAFVRDRDQKAMAERRGAGIREWETRHPIFPHTACQPGADHLSVFVQEEFSQTSGVGVTRFAYLKRGIPRDQRTGSVHEGDPCVDTFEEQIEIGKCKNFRQILH